MFSSKTMTRSLLAAALVASATAARADTIDLVTGWNLNWNISASPSTSPTEDVQIMNLATSANKVFSGWDLGIGFTRVLGSGQLAVNTYANPSNTWAFDPDLTLPPPGTEPDVGAGTGIQIGNTSATNTLYVVPTTPVSLVTLSFKPGTAAPAIGSVFDVWAKGATSSGDSDYVDNQSNSFPYGNTGAAVNGFGDVLLGTVTVTGTVPEPSWLLLLGVAGVGLLIYLARQRICRRAAVGG